MQILPLVGGGTERGGKREIRDHHHSQGFSCGSTGRESAHNEGDLSSIPGLGRSLGEGKPTHFSTHSSILT